MKSIVTLAILVAILSVLAFADDVDEEVPPVNVYRNIDEESDY